MANEGIWGWESWTQLFRIDCFNLRIRTLVIAAGRPLLLPVYLSKNGDILILVCCFGMQAIIYNHRENRVERIRNSNSNRVLCGEFYYTESLVSTQLIESKFSSTINNCLNLWNSCMFFLKSFSISYDVRLIVLENDYLLSIFNGLANY
jgi:hypothetical protein